MKLEHAAIWTEDLETMKDFYVRYFGGKSGRKYCNETKQYESYFVAFEQGARLELMKKAGIPENRNDSTGSQHRGLIHLAFEAATKQEVDEKAGWFASEGIKIIEGPRTTGDCYYEFVILDPENNRIEVTTRDSNHPNH